MQTTNAMQCNPRYKQQYQLSYSLVFLTQEEIETETVPLPFNYVPDDADGIPTTNGAARTDDDDDAEREREREGGSSAEPSPSDKGKRKLSVPSYGEGPSGVPSGHQGAPLGERNENGA